MEEKKELLGCTIRDIVTGFTGIADSKHIYLNGCIRYNVQPKMKDDDTENPKSQHFDVEQLEFIDNGVNEKISSESTGGGKRFIPDRD